MNTFNVTYKNSARVIAIFFIIVLAIAIIAGCGDDNVVNNNGNPPANEVLFSLDSLALITPPFTNDTTFMVSNANSVKITFRAETNADSINGSSLFQVIVIDTANNTTVYDTTYNATLHMNRDFEFIVNPANNVCAINIRIQCLRTPPFVFFMRLKNIKVYKIN